MLSLVTLGSIKLPGQKGQLSLSSSRGRLMSSKLYQLVL